MARYRKIDIQINNDAKFRQLSHMEQWTWFKLMTHERMTSIGAMKVSISGLADELKIQKKQLNRHFFTLIQEKFIHYDEKNLLLWFPNFLKYNTPESPNCIKNWPKALEVLPECELRALLIQHSALFVVENLSKAYSEALPKAFKEGLPEALRQGFANQKQEQKQDNTPLLRKGVCAEPDAKEPIVISILLNDKSEYPVTQSMFTKWQELYPAVAILQELRKMVGWCDAKPENRKTKRGVKTFINTWLAKAQDRAGHQGHKLNGVNGNEAYFTNRKPSKSEIFSNAIAGSFDGTPFSN
jgi:hypothetical protein